MKTLFLVAAVVALLVAPSAGALAPSAPQDDERPELEGPPGPPQPDEPETTGDEPETAGGDSETAGGDSETAAESDEATTSSGGGTVEQGEELEGPGEEQAPQEPDLILGLDPGGMPMVPESEPTKYGTDDVRKGLFLIGAGIGIGIFLPRHVNDYLEDWTSSHGATDQVGFSEMLLNFVPRVTATYIPIEYVQLQILGEIGWAPKVMTVTGAGAEEETEFFHYVRYSPGALANFHLPVNANRQAIFVGGGVLYHWLRFEGGGADYKAEALGYRAQLGYRFYIRAIAPEVFVAFDYVKADSNKAIAPGEQDMILEYTGGMIGGNFYFDLTSAIGAGSGAT
jgi:hypothetical protein